MPPFSDTLKQFWRARIKPLLQSKKPPPPSLPLGLTADQLEQLQSLTESPAYKHYLGALERLYENNLGAILRGLPHEAYMFQCGVCFALEQIAKLPADLTAKANELHARHTASPTPDASGDAARALFASTPYWDAYQRRGPRQYGGAGISIPGGLSGGVPPQQNGD